MEPVRFERVGETAPGLNCGIRICGFAILSQVGDLRPEGPAFDSHVREGVDQSLLKVTSAAGAEQALGAKEVSALRAWRSWWVFPRPRGRGYKVPCPPGLRDADELRGSCGNLFQTLAITLSELPNVHPGS